MACISTNAKGFKRLVYVYKKKQEAIYLGNIPVKLADSFKSKFENLLGQLKANLPLDGMTAEWLAGLDDEFYGKLADKGLVPPRVFSGVTTLGAFIDAYHAKRDDWAPNSLKNHKQCRGWLLDFFGIDKNVKAITEHDAEDFRRYLTKELAEDWVRRLCGFARQYFSAMGKMIDANPFGTMKNIAMKGNAARYFFMDHDLTKQVMQAMPDAEWRLVFGLCRFAGFRCPSEHSALRWDQIDRKKGRVAIDSPKTGLRTFPLFPELVPLLDEMPKRSERVFPDYRPDINLRRQFMRSLAKAKIEPWPKLFQNLRSTRETELMELYPAHVVCAWLGNTEAVAKKHYLQVTEEHYQKAATRRTTVQPAKVGGIDRQPRTSTTKNLRGFTVSRLEQAMESTPNRSRRTPKSRAEWQTIVADDSQNDSLSRILGF